MKLRSQWNVSIAITYDVNFANESINKQTDEKLTKEQEKYSDFTWKFGVFWKTSRWGEVVAYERLWQPAVRL